MFWQSPDPDREIQLGVLFAVLSTSETQPTN
jgi:hypothetical protein